MPVTECPHCYRRVLPTAQGHCPACRKNMSDAAGVDPNLAGVVISETMRMPPYCIFCGNSTDRLQHLDPAVVADKKGPVAKALLGVLRFFAQGWIGTMQQLNERMPLSFEVPVCDACTRDCRPEPRDIDVVERKIRLVVHNKFKQELLKMKEST